MLDGRWQYERAKGKDCSHDKLRCYEDLLCVHTYHIPDLAEHTAQSKHLGRPVHHVSEPRLNKSHSFIRPASSTKAIAYTRVSISIRLYTIHSIVALGD